MQSCALKQTLAQTAVRTSKGTRRVFDIITYISQKAMILSERWKG
jgi:hypothetical protein